MYVHWNRPSTTVHTDGQTVSTTVGRVNYTAPDLSWIEIRTDDGEFITVKSVNVLSHVTRV